MGCQPRRPTQQQFEVAFPEPSKHYNPRFFLCHLAVLLAVCSFSLSAEAVATDIKAQMAQLSATQFEEPLIATVATTAQEDAALLAAIDRYSQHIDADNYQALTDYLVNYPKSGWKVALLTNMGLSYYRSGRFSLAIDAFEQAWKLGKGVTELRGKALVDRALGELMRMHARIGHVSKLEEMFKDIGNRPVSGSATELVRGSRDGLWLMHNEPGVAFLCGPMALKNLLLSQGKKAEKLQFIDAYRSSRQGVSLSEVDRLAKQAKLAHNLIYRKPDQALPIPAIVHWKVGHYAAIVGEEKGRYHLQDPTFGDDLWVTKAAIDNEASGYFLVPGKHLEKGWRPVQLAEAKKIHGMGATGNSLQTSTTAEDEKAKPEKKCPPNQGMCGYNVHELLVSLNLNDTPVGYAPPKGPSVYTTLTYNHREIGQPANFSYFNVSQKWTLNWLSYVQDDPSVQVSSVTYFPPGGGNFNYEGFNSVTGFFGQVRQDRSVLVRISGSPIKYERRLADGGVEIYAQTNGGSATLRRVFLSKIIDPAGNALTLNYDGQQRLLSVADALGRNTAFTYGNVNFPFSVTKITDPFGRFATLAYDVNGRLASITDVIGITSTFHYNANSLIDSMTTPYGTTTFAFSDPTTDGEARWLEATDPLGFKERFEYGHHVASISVTDPTNLLPKDNTTNTPLTYVTDHNSLLYSINSFYWDKNAIQNGATAFTNARIKHWSRINAGTAGNTVESIKYPLENRVWFRYPGTSGNAGAGTLDHPDRAARVLDGNPGLTQLSQTDYNDMGYVTKTVDPLGRETTYEYAANNIDLLRIKQKTSATGTTALTAQFTYNALHRPLTYTDAAGKITTFIYNAAGQVTKVTDALNLSTSYAYDAFGYLATITNANNLIVARYTYDAVSRVASVTDSEGRVVNYNYDNLDRLTKITYPDGTTKLLTYNKLDLVSETDRQGRKTQYGYDANRNLISVINPLLQETSYTYYPNGTLKTLIDGNGNVTTWHRDIQSRITDKTYDDGRQEFYDYEFTTSRLKTITDGLNQVKLYTYALDDRQIKVEYQNAAVPTPSVTFNYDPFFPRLTSMVDGTGTTQYQYYAPALLGALKLKQTDGPYANDTLSYTYDALGRMATRVIDTASETFTYDTIGRVTSHVSKMGTFNQTYLGQTDQMTSQKLASTTLSVGTNWQYDTNVADRRLLAITGLSQARAFNYTTTPENLVSRANETAAAPYANVLAKDWNYTYDTADRVITAQYTSPLNNFVANYSYDPADNLTNVNYAGTIPTNYISNTTNQISLANTTPFLYDANGNLIDDGVHGFQWDAENRLYKIFYRATPTKSTLFRYDGLGRWVGIISANVPALSERRFLWCGNTLCQERTSADVVKTHYFPEGQDNIQLGTYKTYYVRDRLNSIRAQVNYYPNNTTDASYFEYDTYGIPRTTIVNGPNVAQFKYAGMFYLPEAGLYLANYRVYDPINFRWLNRDPIGETGGVNLYAYVAGNPVNFTDPYGLDREIIFWSPLPHPGSIFGHVSSRGGNGENNSFGPEGWDRTYPTADAYAQRQTDNNKRVGMGVVADLTPDQDAKYDQCIKSSKNSGSDYDPLTNNCGTAAQACLIGAGVPILPSILPGSFQQELLNSGSVKSINWYRP